ncbi:MAG: sodium:proton antiporter [Calditrichia bacterium]
MMHTGRCKLILIAVLLSIFLFSQFLFAQEEHSEHQAAPGHSQTIEPPEGEHGSTLGSVLPLWSVLPFVGILLSIAIFPLTAPHFWHKHYGKISLFWALLLAIPFILTYQQEAVHEILEIYLEEYIPFIILLWALFTIAGGILLKGAPVGTPFANLVLLIIGTFFASWIGTTGAAMILIRPLIRMNKFRKSKVHLIVFFIFLVANIGGSLTPLGDPPLFLGFLNGVPFFWTFNLFTEMLFVAGIVLIIFYLIDSYMFRKEGWHEKMHLKEHRFEEPAHLHEITVEEKEGVENNRANKIPPKEEKMSLNGLVNILFLLGVIGGVLFSGFVHLGKVNVLGVHMAIEGIVRDFVLIFMGLLSLKFTRQEIREGNEFGWFPIIEVAKLFAGIFMTMVPALAILRAGESGHLDFLIKTVTEPWHYFWITGSLSSFLDNAPTYLTFLNTALGKFFHGVPVRDAVHMLIDHKEIYLKAISTGAVFFGAMTYIGNAPNFMVKSIAEENKISMPSFFGYMGYSILLLVPVFMLVTWVFF